MPLKKIRVGLWYQTTRGVGQCLSVGGTFPPSCRFRIVAPLPLGVLTLSPRQVEFEVARPPKLGADEP